MFIQSPTIALHEAKIYHDAGAYLGPKVTIDVYLRPLVEELLLL
jgi:hypothetical protein